MVVNVYFRDFSVRFFIRQTSYLVGGTISIEADTQLIVALVLAGEGYPRSQGYLGEFRERLGLYHNYWM